MAKRQRRRREERRQEHAKRRVWKTRHSVITGAGLTAGAVLGVGATAHAANFEVDRSDDSGSVSACTVAPNDCNLRGAVDASNASGTYDSITFQSGITGITLNNYLGIYDGVYIHGNGAAATTISGGNAHQIFYVDPGYAEPVNLYGLTLANGSAYRGAAIYNKYANLNIYDSL